jgi:hypothetical protein
VFPVAQVKFAVNTETGEKVAIKILDKEKIQKQNMGGALHSCVASWLDSAASESRAGFRSFADV